MPRYNAVSATLHVVVGTFEGMWKIKGLWINDGNNHGV
jgi:hypothetical protein